MLEIFYNALILNFLICFKFQNNSILKHLASSIGTHSNEIAENIEQITYLQTLIVIKATKLEKLVMENNTAYFAQEEKAQLLNLDVKMVKFI